MIMMQIGVGENDEKSEPFGELNIELSDALKLIGHMLWSSSNVGFLIEKIGVNELVLWYEYDISTSPVASMSDQVAYSYWYRFATDGHMSDFEQLIGIAYSVAFTHRELCSETVLEFIETNQMAMTTVT